MMSHAKRVRNANYMFIMMSSSLKRNKVQSFYMIVKCPVRVTTICADGEKRGNSLSSLKEQI